MMKTSNRINILIACEESQVICTEFRKLGFNCFSCDLKECSGGHPEWHILGDVLKVFENKIGMLQNGEYVIVNRWDLVVAHPPCTYLSLSGERWLNSPRYPNRRNDRNDAAKFFMEFTKLDTRVAIENPVGCMSRMWRKPDQIVQPYNFGDEASKRTCLWLQGLPKLEHTKEVEHGEYIITKKGNKVSKWFSDSYINAKTAEERRTLRSETFPGIAKAIAYQWGKYLLEVC